MSEVPITRTPWTTRDLLAAYAEAWRTVVGGEASRACLALLWGQASLECSRNGANCYGNNVGNVMAFASWTGDYHVLRGAPECAAPDRVPAGATVLRDDQTTIRCAPGQVAYLPAGGSRFRAYPTLLDGCTDKLRVLDRQWPRAIVALSGATGPEAADGFVLGLVGPPRYFTGPSSGYATMVRSLAAECLRATRAEDWPDAHTADTDPAPPAAVDAPIVELPRDGRTQPLWEHVEGEHSVEPEDPKL